MDLIVMGTHGRTGYERYLLGSVAEKVVRIAPIPVLTIAVGETDQQAEDILRAPTADRDSNTDADTPSPAENKSGESHSP